MEVMFPILPLREKSFFLVLNWSVFSYVRVASLENLINRNNNLPVLPVFYSWLNMNNSAGNSTRATSFTEQGYILSIELFPAV